MDQIVELLNAAWLCSLLLNSLDMQVIKQVSKEPTTDHCPLLHHVQRIGTRRISFIVPIGR
jgi:hypothetical protein